MPIRIPGRAVLATLALMCAGTAFCAEQHSVQVRITSTKGAGYEHTLRLAQGKPLRYSESNKFMFNGTLKEGGAGTFRLTYSLELSGGPGIVIQNTGEVAMRPGGSIAVTECGPWKVQLVLDGAKGGGKTGRAAKWSASGLPNYRVTGNASSEGTTQKCSVVSALGAQSSVVDSKDNGYDKHAFILNSTLSAGGSGGFRLEYQLEKNSFTGSTVQITGKETLPLNGGKTVNKRDANSNKPIKVDFLLEGDAPAAGGEKPKKDGYGTVQLL